jgi:hypothetical protein
MKGGGVDKKIQWPTKFFSGIERGGIFEYRLRGCDNVVYEASAILISMVRVTDCDKDWRMFLFEACSRQSNGKAMSTRRACGSRNFDDGSVVKYPVVINAANFNVAFKAQGASAGYVEQSRDYMWGNVE